MQKRSTAALKLFRSEVETARKILYRAKNTHRVTRIYQKLRLLVKLCNRFLERRMQDRASSIAAASQDLYVLTTSNIAIGEFVGYSLLILGICARIHYLVRKIESERSSEVDGIDALFADIEEQ
jgi:hypothetical protein